MRAHNTASTRITKETRRWKRKHQQLPHHWVMKPICVCVRACVYATPNLNMPKTTNRIYRNKCERNFLTLSTKPTKVTRRTARAWPTAAHIECLRCETHSFASLIRIIDHYTLHILVSFCRNGIRRRDWTIWRAEQTSAMLKRECFLTSMWIGRPMNATMSAYKQKWEKSVGRKRCFLRNGISIEC